VIVATSAASAGTYIAITAKDPTAAIIGGAIAAAAFGIKEALGGKAPASQPAPSG